MNKISVNIWVISVSFILGVIMTNLFTPFKSLKYKKDGMAFILESKSNPIS